MCVCFKSHIRLKCLWVSWVFVLIAVVNRASQVALAVKNLPANAGDIRDMGSIPGWGRSPGGEHDNTLQYSCLESPMDRGAWPATVHGAAKSGTWLKCLIMHTVVNGFFFPNLCSQGLSPIHGKLLLLLHIYIVTVVNTLVTLHKLSWGFHDTVTTSENSNMWIPFPFQLKKSYWFYSPSWCWKLSLSVHLHQIKSQRQNFGWSRKG